MPSDSLTFEEGLSYTSSFSVSEFLSVEDLTISSGSSISDLRILPVALSLDQLEGESNNAIIGYDKYQRTVTGLYDANEAIKVKTTLVGDTNDTPFLAINEVKVDRAYIRLAGRITVDEEWKSVVYSSSFDNLPVLQISEDIGLLPLSGFNIVIRNSSRYGFEVGLRNVGDIESGTLIWNSQGF